jgi:hypothetical protein
MRLHVRICHAHLLLSELALHRLRDEAWLPDRMSSIQPDFHLRGELTHHRGSICPVAVIPAARTMPSGT